MWSARAERNLREIQKWIAEAGVPKTAKEFVNRLRKAARRLRDFPESGGVIEEPDLPEIREIFVKDYRIVYRYEGNTVLVLTVIHGSRMFGTGQLESE